MNLEASYRNIIPNLSLTFQCSLFFGSIYLISYRYSCEQLIPIFRRLVKAVHFVVCVCFFFIFFHAETLSLGRRLTDGDDGAAPSAQRAAVSVVVWPALSFHHRRFLNWLVSFSFSLELFYAFQRKFTGSCPTWLLGFVLVSLSERRFAWELKPFLKKSNDFVLVSVSRMFQYNN